MTKQSLKTIDSSKYRQLTDIEHVLHRPVTYTGSVKAEERTMYFVYADKKIYPEQTVIVPAALTFANELLNNAYDEYRRSINEDRPKKLSRIDVIVNLQNKSLTVRDDGGIPIAIHEESGKVLPSLLFGQLRTGGNYDDSKRLDLAGVNGIGAVLVNIFSKNFYVDTCDTIHSFTQGWHNNMSIEDTAIITETKNSPGFTRIIAELDDTRLPIEAYSVNWARFIEMRCAELAAMGSDSKHPLTVTWLTIHENGEEWKNEFCFREFNDFLKLWPDYDNMLVDNQHRFSVALSLSLGSQESVALVNSIRCDWGTHIDCFVDACTYHIRTHIQNKFKIDIKPAKIRQYIRTISIWNINAPDFGSQTKEQLTTKPIDFGMPVVPSEKFIKALLKSSVVNQIVEELHNRIFAQRQELLAQQQKNLDSRTKKNIMPLQLTDAANAGKPGCTLFVVEGDSAATGFNKHRTAATQGVFAMRGKSCGNMIYADELKVMSNKSIAGLMQAQGLNFLKNSKLRYDKVVMAQDADYDGYSILGLMLVFYNKFFPELIENGNLYRLKTPIYIARKGNDVRRFYTQEQFFAEEEFLNKNKFTIKYHKGLASLADREYELMMDNPVLARITKDDLSDSAIDAWFGGDSSIRKDMMSILAELDGEVPMEFNDYFNDELNEDAINDTEL